MKLYFFMGPAFLANCLFNSHSRDHLLIFYKSIASWSKIPPRKRKFLEFLKISKDMKKL